MQAEAGVETPYTISLVDLLDGVESAGRFLEVDALAFGDGEFELPADLCVVRAGKRGCITFGVP